MRGVILIELSLGLKIGYTLFVCVVVPIYWRQYGPANFLWFSDIALLAMVPALWLENALLASTMAVSIIFLRRNLEHRFFRAAGDRQVIDRAERVYVRSQDSVVHSCAFLFSHCLAVASALDASSAGLRSTRLPLPNNSRARGPAGFLSVQ